MIEFQTVSALPRLLTNTDMKALGKILGRTLRWRSHRTVGVRFVSPTLIQKLNRQYRKINRPTDVLSFKLTADRLQVTDYLGDLLICSSEAQKNARRQKISLREELIRLLAHGVLHLAGFDHATKSEERKMFALQERCVKSLIV